MSRVRGRALIWALLIVASASVGACRGAVVIVPQNERGYTERDTLYGQMDGDQVRIVFRHDTTWRTDTVVRLDTLWRGGTRIIRDTVVQHDTLRFPMVLPRSRRDSISPAPVRVDTVYVASRRVRVDTLRLTVRDTVVVSGQRVLFVPPGQFPPAGQCRVWIHDLPPGQQAKPAQCSSLGAIPRGAFVLFDGKAYDADYDWVMESRKSKVPAEILALRRGGGR